MREEERSRDSAHFRERGRIRCYVRRSSALISLGHPLSTLTLTVRQDIRHANSVAHTARVRERKRASNPFEVRIIGPPERIDRLARMKLLFRDRDEFSRPAYFERKTIDIYASSLSI